MEQQQRPWECYITRAFVCCIALNRPGSDLLSHALRRSTIGAEEFDDRVRDGIGYGLLAITTGPIKSNTEKLEFFR